MKSKLRDGLAPEQHLLVEIFGTGSGHPNKWFKDWNSAKVVELGKVLLEVISSLSDIEAKTLRLRFGLMDSRPPLTQEEVAVAMGFSRDRARQLITKALLKLRHPTRSRPLVGFTPHKA